MCGVWDAEVLRCPLEDLQLFTLSSVARVSATVLCVIPTAFALNPPMFVCVCACVYVRVCVLTYFMIAQHSLICFLIFHISRGFPFLVPLPSLPPVQF